MGASQSKKYKCRDSEAKPSLQLECPICQERFPADQLYVLDCEQDHKMCVPCAVSLVDTGWSVMTRDGDPSVLRCPGEQHRGALGKPHTLTPQEVAQIRALGSELVARTKRTSSDHPRELARAVARLPTEEEFARHCTRALLREMGLLASQCPKCSNIVELPSADGRHRVACECGLEYCSRCKKRYHYRTHCDEVAHALEGQVLRDERRGVQCAAQRAALAEEKERMQAIEEHTRPCPQCFRPNGPPIECNHVTCECGFQYCWDCLSEFRKTKRRGLTHGWVPALDADASAKPLDCLAEQATVAARIQRLRRQWFEAGGKEGATLPPSNITCDECQGGGPRAAGTEQDLRSRCLNGVYYTCVHCPFFNLCAKCEATSQHTRNSAAHVLREVRA